MAYIGKQPETKFSAAAKIDRFTGDGSTTAFDLANIVPAGGENSLMVYIDNVRQEPGSSYAFTVGNDGSGDLKRITFTSAPGSSASIYVITPFEATTMAGPADGTITYDKLSNDSNNVISGATELAEQRADDDLFLVYDTSTSTIKKIQASNVASDLDINATTELAETPASADEFIIYDATAAANRKVTYANIVPTLTYTSGTDTGDGSTQGFTIDSGRSVNDVLVYVNGFNLVPTTDYTISGTTLTFQTAPASGAEIAYRYLPLSGTATYTNDTATGDGSTQGFTIDSGRTVEDVIVTVNGVTLVPTDDYTISGTTLTFVSAPASSAEISIRYLRLT